MARMFKYLKHVFLILALTLLGIWMLFAFKAWRAEPLQIWHTYVPKEMIESKLDEADWQSYLAHEAHIFEEVRREITLKLPPQARVPSNRYYENAINYPPNLSNDWNRSYIMEPDGPPVGAVVLLHGLTDSPYSLRHVARLYVKHGFIAIGIRLPGHGTVPAGLTDATWQDWMAATRLAVREAKKRIGPDTPLHLVGFSNGGALAMKYALDALEDTTLARPDRLVLLSPMIGITRFAHFVGITAMPALLPPFAGAAWLSVLPEFNPFKYNSFPVNGARQSHRLTRVLQQQIERLSRTEKFATLPPVLTFQSLLDYTVSTPAILYSLYNLLPENGSELVLFDINQASLLEPLMRSATSFALNRILPPFPQRYTLSVVGNRTPNDLRTSMRSTEAGGVKETVRELAFLYPASVFSLSHVSIPFPMDDPLYGMTPGPGSEEKYGFNLGALSLRGERGALIINMEALARTSSNPFFPLLLEKMEEGIKNPQPAPGSPALLSASSPSPEKASKAVDAFLHEAEKPWPYDEAGP